MAEVTQLMFSPTDILRTMIKEQGIKNGLWALSVEFSFTAAVAGPTPDASVPSAIIGVNKIGLQRSDTPGPMILDAADVNP